jgi:hypothetical protein
MLAMLSRPARFLESEPMESDYKDDFFRGVYNSEIENKHKLDAADNLLVVVLLALSGVGIYYAKLLQSCSFGVAGWFFLVCTILFLIALGGAIGFLIASFWPRKREFVSSPKKWNDFVESMRHYYNYHFRNEADENVPTEEAEGHVSVELVNALREKYIQAGEVNYIANLNKMAYQARTKFCITAAVIVMLLNAIPTYFTQCDNHEIQKIEIVTPKSKDTLDGRKDTAASIPASTQNTDAQTGTSQAATAPEPSITGGTDNGQPKGQVKKD